MNNSTIAVFKFSLFVWFFLTGPQAGSANPLPRSGATSFFLPPPCILLQNTSFDDSLTDWVSAGSTSSTTDAYAGTHAAQIDGSYAYIYQVQSGITPGNVYTLSAFAKTEGSPSQAALGIQFYDSGLNLLGESFVSTNSTSYEQFYVAAMAPDNAVYINVYALKFGSGLYKVDEFCLEESVPAIDQCILAQNPDFENGLTNWPVSGSVNNTADAVSGSGAAQLISNNSQLAQQFSIRGGQTYEFTAWAKVGDKVPSQAELYLEWRDVNNNVISDIIQPVLSTTKSYTHFSLKGKAPANAAYAAIGAFKKGSSSRPLYVDNVCFRKINDLTGSGHDLACGCTDNLLPNGGFDEHFVGSFPYSLEGVPVATLSDNNGSSLPPHLTDLDSDYLFLIDDSADNVNNPAGEHFIFLPDENDELKTQTDFSGHLQLEPGETYRICLFAAAWNASIGSNGLPDGGTEQQRAGILYLKFDHQNGNQDVAAWAVPASDDFSNLSWTKFTHTFIYDGTDPIQSFSLENMRNNTGIAIDAVSIAKTDCQPIVDCGATGLNYKRWTGIPNPNLRELLTSPDFPNNPDEIGLLANYQGYTSIGENYGTQAYGYIVPSITGNYTFNITSDDEGRFFLSSDSSFFNKTMVATVPGWTNENQHNKYAEQTSSAIYLVAGQKYYTEVVQKEGWGGDHFGVHWRTPVNNSWNIVPGANLRPQCRQEICNNGLDDDLDGLTDCEDGDCFGSTGTTFAVTDENCGSGGGAINLTVSSLDHPLSFQWSDMPVTAHWNFEASTDDASGNLNHANYLSGTPLYSGDAVEGQNSIYFNGSTRIRYSIDGGFMEQAFSALSVSVWVKPDDLTGIKTIIDEGGSASCGGRGFALRLLNGSLSVGVRNGNCSFASDASLTLPNDGEWHHVAAVFDNGNLTAYLDGTPGPTVAAPFSTINNHGNNGGIGGNFGGSVLNSGSTRFRGFMDDFRYHAGTALNAAQVADIARNDGDRTDLFAGTYTVAVTTASGCSDQATITVNSLSNHTNGGAVSGDETFCASSSDPGMISSTAAATGGGAGTTEYQWQSSTDGGTTWADISGAGAENHDPSSISQTTLYRRGGRLNPCLAFVYSNVVTKSFTENFDDPGAINGAETSCGAFDPIAVFEDLPPAGGSGGSAEFQWQQSTDSLVWADIPGAGAASFDPANISQTTWYRRGSRRSPCVDFVFSQTVKKEVVINFTDAGNIAGQEDNCGSFDPGIISSVTMPAGGSGGSLVFQWQTSTDGGATWTDLSGATAATIDPTTIVETQQYRRGCRRSPCADFVFSNTITKMVALNFTSGGLISGDESECGGYDPGPIFSLSQPSGGTDGYMVFSWEASTDGGITWGVISGAAGLTYDPAPITETTTFRRKSRRAPCTEWIFSNVVIKEVKNVPSPTLLGGPMPVNGFICEFFNYTFEAADAGSGATYGWDFGSLATPSSASGPGPHEVNFNVSNVAAFTSVTVQLTVYENGCAGIATFDYDIRPQITVTSLNTTDPTNCAVNDGRIEVSTDHPGGTTVEASIDGGASWMAEPIDFTNQSAGVYELRLRYAGTECEYAWGNVSLTDPGSLTAEIQISTMETCVGEMFQVEAIPDGLGSPSYTWNFGPDATPSSAFGTGPHQVSYSAGGEQHFQLSISQSFCVGTVDTFINITNTYTDGGTLNGAEDLCNGGNGSTMSTQIAPSGGFGGTPDYQWETREEDGIGGWTAWAEIAGATGESYTPNFINKTTEYRRKARRLPCMDWAVSAPVAKKVAGVPQPVDDLFTEACPGFLFYGYVDLNDQNISAPVYKILTQPLNGTLDLDSDGEFVYTPNAFFCGTDEFTYEVCNHGTTCCATAKATIDLSDSELPILQNIPENLLVHCDDELPAPPIVDAWENCHSVTLGLDEASNQGALDSCSIFNYSLTRTWTASDYCGNSASDQQVISIEDRTAPNIYRVYVLPNGKKMVAGVMDNVSHRWKTIGFPVQFGSRPVVLAQIVTENSTTAAVTRLRNVSDSHFQLRLQEEENEDGKHTEERVAWIAFEEGANTDGTAFEVGTKLVSSAGSTVAFDQPYTNPGFVGAVQTFNETDPVALRINSLNSTTASIFLQEETSLDPEANHGFETVGYLAVEGAGDLTNEAGEVIGETGKVSTDHNEVTINLNHTYHNPVVVLGGVTMLGYQEVIVQVKNLTSNSFDLRVKEWEYLDDWHVIENLTYVVVEGSIPFDQEVECSAIPPVPVLGVEIVGLDNCDPSAPVTVTDSDFAFDCLGDIFYTRKFHVQDECGNTTTLTQTFTLRDTTPPVFSAPADLTITCLTNRHDLGITGDVTDEMDNCADDLQATYSDNADHVSGCSGYFIRAWVLTDLCGNLARDTQIITIFNDNDTDGDGLADPFDLDDDNDGLPDADEGTADTDGDGIPDSQDLDSDNDGLPDIIEAGFADANGDGKVDTYGQTDWDIDGDGLANIVDGDPTDPALLASDIFEPITDERDRDNDGISNWIDLDSDNDGLPDLIEAGGADMDGNGIVDYPDPANPESLLDADGDGFYDAFDPDDDNLFGIDDAGDVLVSVIGSSFTGGQASYSPDADGDGVPDFYDLDSDNDGITDLIEAGGIDTNGDGRIDTGEFEDMDGNGFHDEYETNALVITEPDGPNADGRPEDDDGDGSAYELADADSDNVPNHRDTDADGDGINDITEVGTASLDLDGSGRIGALVDANNDGLNDASSGQIFTDGEGLTNDGRPEDDLDADSSTFGSTLADGTFGEFNGQPDLDDDGDSLPNFLDTDSDNDLLPDATEDTNGNGIADSGETGYLDTDSDDDGLIDGVEDADQDGVFDEGEETDPLNPDTDGDTLSDGVEDLNHDGIIDAPAESDPTDPCDPVINPACKGVYLSVKVKLKGALSGNLSSGLMRDDLRSKALLPLKEPYTAMEGFFHFADGGGEETADSVFAKQGQNAIVDWVFIELREPASLGSVVNTRAALLQRDGDVVDMDGESPVFFESAPSGLYHVAIRHRNHLGTGIALPVVLSPSSTHIDLTSADTEIFGQHGTDVDSEGGIMLWPGDANSDNEVIYQGPVNDGYFIFFDVLSDPANDEQLANFIRHSYDGSDINLDGMTIFQGPGNDRSKILFQSILDTPENIEHLANFIVSDKLP